jgi:hypothetical protein
VEVASEIAFLKIGKLRSAKESEKKNTKTQSDVLPCCSQLSGALALQGFQKHFLAERFVISQQLEQWVVQFR